jgi:chorismate mutase
MMNPTRPALVIAVLCSLMLPARVAALAPLDSLGVWVQRVAARNAMAHDVAAYKFVAGRPIEDPQREAAVLAEKRDRAVQRGVDPDAAVHTYRQLIEANKLLQHADFQRFLLGRTPSPPPSLDAIRERIDTLDERLLSQWAQLDDVRAAPDCPRQLARAIARQGTPGAPLDDATRIALVRATLGFCPHDGVPAGGVAGAAQNDAAGH